MRWLYINISGICAGFYTATVKNSSHKHLHVWKKNDPENSNSYKTCYFAAGNQDFNAAFQLLMDIQGPSGWSLD